MTPKSLDFNKVEVLRRHMLMTHAHMAQVLGVSRATYHNWLRGKPIRQANEAHAKKMVRKLIATMTIHKWPTMDVISLSPDTRHQRLLALLEQD
jgi:DNA-binding XRE family transcriptional regulator